MTFNISDCWSSNKHTITIAMSFVVLEKSSKDNKNLKLWLKNSKNDKLNKHNNCFQSNYDKSFCQSTDQNWLSVKGLCNLGHHLLTRSTNGLLKFCCISRDFIFLFFQCKLKTHIFLNWHPYGMMVQCSALNNKPFVVLCTCKIKRRLWVKLKYVHEKAVFVDLAINR